MVDTSTGGGKLRDRITRRELNDAEVKNIAANLLGGNDPDLREQAADMLNRHSHPVQQPAKSGD